jgi:hypothetical protein
MNLLPAVAEGDGVFQLRALFAEGFEIDHDTPQDGSLGQ